MPTQNHHISIGTLHLVGQQNNYNIVQTTTLCFVHCILKKHTQPDVFTGQHSSNECARWVVRAVRKKYVCTVTLTRPENDLVDVVVAFAVLVRHVDRPDGVDAF